jgi:hypothetical protein
LFTPQFPWPCRAALTRVRRPFSQNCIRKFSVVIFCCTLLCFSYHPPHLIPAHLSASESALSTTLMIFHAIFCAHFASLHFALFLRTTTAAHGGSFQSVHNSLFPFCTISQRDFFGLVMSCI